MYDLTPIFGFCCVHDYLVVTWSDNSSTEKKHFLEIYDSTLKHVATHIEVPKDLYLYLYSNEGYVYFLRKSRLSGNGEYENPILMKFGLLAPSIRDTQN